MHAEHAEQGTAVNGSRDGAPLLQLEGVALAPKQASFQL